MTRLLIADGHALFRAAVRNILEAELDLEVVGEAAAGSELLAQVGDLRPDVLLLEVPHAPLAGVELIERLTARYPRLRILVVTDQTEDHVAVRCLRAGADGYLTKNRAAHDLVKAVRHVAGGRKYVTPPLAEHLATAVAERALGAPAHEALSPRELEVLRGLGQARTVSEISRQLGLSPKTVSTYRTRAIEKLGLRNSAEAMLYAVQHGLVETPTTSHRGAFRGRDKKNPPN
jgi:DNA-binding NarL/FixJ family response regulator